jgi:predicted transcriptional regulator
MGEEGSRLEELFEEQDRLHKEHRQVIKASQEIVTRMAEVSKAIEEEMEKVIVDGRTEEDSDVQSE